MIAALAETNHPPFDLVEAEQELVGGFHTEYTGIRFAMFFLAEFMNLITMCAIAVTLFFGGPSGPSASDLGIASDTSWINTWLLPVFWFMLKLLVLLYATVWVRASLPRLRYDQLMNLGWKVLIEFAFVWALATGVMVVAINDGKSGWDLSLVLISVFLGAFAIYGVLLTGCDAARARRSRGGDQVVGALSGFRVTLAQVFKRKVTEDYPKHKRPKPARFHGRHVLNRYEDGMEKCIGCELCAGVCPARCIYVRGADNPPDAPVSPGERYGFVYEINYLRCIHCDLCVEACPTEAITETKLFEFSFTNRQDAIYTRSELLVDDAGARRRQPWELWLGGEDDDDERLDARHLAVGSGGVRGLGQLVGRVGIRDPRRGTGTV